MNLQADAPLRFGRLDASHLDAVLAIEVEAYPEPWTRAMFREEIRSEKSHFYVMSLGDELVGYGGFWLVLDEAHITSLTIRDVFRGRGYGRRLLRFIERAAATAGARMATLEVRESNSRARKLYTTAGYRIVGVRRGYYAKTKENGVVMLKPLGKRDFFPENRVD